MNGEDPFERRLQREQQRPIPPSWRAEILSAAREAALSARTSHATEPSPIVSWFLALLWPHPRAWAGLAAVWLVVVGLNLSSREPSPEQLASSPTPASPQQLELLRQQEQMFAELLGPLGRADADRAKPASPKPRSDAGHEFIMA